jgi:hypothetical protein
MMLLHPYPVNATVSNARISQRMLELVQELSVEEKVALLAGRDFSSLAAIPRLGIPSIKVDTGCRLEVSWENESNSF